MAPTSAHLTYTKRNSIPDRATGEEQPHQGALNGSRKGSTQIGSWDLKRKEKGTVVTGSWPEGALEINMAGNAGPVSSWPGVSPLTVCDLMFAPGQGTGSGSILVPLLGWADG